MKKQMSKKKQEKKELPEKKNAGKLWLILLVGVLLIAIIPRGIELLSHNYLWGFDQGEHYLAVKDIVVNHNMTLIGTKVGGGGGFFQGPGWYYLLTIPFFLAGGDPYAGMVLMFAVGVATVFFSYYFGKKMFDEKTALAIAFFIAISPTIISQSRFIWPPFPISLLTVFYLYTLFKLLNGEKKYLPLVTFTVGMMSHFEMATAGTLIVQFALFSPILFWKRLVTVKYFLLSLLSFLLPLSPLIIFDFRNQHIILNGMINMLNNKVAVVLPYAWVVKNHSDVFWGSFFSTFYSSGTLRWALIIFACIGTFLYMRSKEYSQGQKLFVFYLLTSPILLFIVFLKYPQGMWEWWILQMPIIYCYLFAILLMSFWKHRYAAIVISVVLLFFGGSYVKQTLAWYKNDLNDFGGTHKIQGKMEALDYIYKDAAGKPFSLFAYTPPIYTYAYDYATWWYGNKTYGYMPGSEKKGLFYLWIEVDPNKPWTHKGWMETVIKDGKVLETVTLPKSGFIIQKRMMSDSENETPTKE